MPASVPARRPAAWWSAVVERIPPLHPAGRPFVAGAVALGIVGWRSGRARGLALLAAGLTAWAFRDPTRVPPSQPGVVVAPADGEITAVDEAVPPPELGLSAGPRPRVTIVTSPTDVFVLRSPALGRLAEVTRAEASDTAAESLLVRIHSADGEELGVALSTHVLGRAVCEAGVGDDLLLGQPYGVLRFGGRTELYLPVGVTLVPVVGQRAVAGETVLATL